MARETEKEYSEKEVRDDKGDWCSEGKIQITMRTCSKKKNKDIISLFYYILNLDIVWGRN